MTLHLHPALNEALSTVKHSNSLKHKAEAAPCVLDASAMVIGGKINRSVRLSIECRELHGGYKDTATYSGMRYADGVSTEILCRGDGMGLLKGQNRSQVGSMVGFCIRFWVWVCDMA